MIEVSCLHAYHVFIAPLLHRMSCLVNCNVVLKSFLGAPRVVYPWKIVVAEQPGLSVRQFYKTIEPDIQTSSTVSQLALASCRGVTRLFKLWRQAENVPS